MICRGGPDWNFFRGRTRAVRGLACPPSCQKRDDCSTPTPLCLWSRGEGICSAVEGWTVTVFHITWEPGFCFGPEHDADQPDMLLIATWMSGFLSGPNHEILLPQNLSRRLLGEKTRWFATKSGGRGERRGFGDRRGVGVEGGRGGVMEDSLKDTVSRVYSR